MSTNPKFNLLWRCIHLPLIMLLMLCSYTAFAEASSAEPDGFKVQGNVSDEKGEPLIGAAIFMQNDKSVNAIPAPCRFPFRERKHTRRKDLLIYHHFHL